MNIIVFVDYDNLLPLQKEGGMLDVVTKVLMKLLKNPTLERGSCEIRIYGGWYEGIEMTTLAQNLFVSLQKDFPTVIRLPTSSGKNMGITVKAALATSLLQEPGHHLFNTFRKKGRLNNVRVQKKSDIGCSDPGCVLPHAANLLKTGKCPISNCGKENLIYRNEQKIVDTMLSCDLIYSHQQGFDHIVLISSDDDFIPPLRTLMLSGKPIARFHPKYSNQRQEIQVASYRLVELEL